MIQKANSFEGLHVSYYRHWTGNMVIKLHCLQQELMTSLRHFQRVFSIDYGVEVGCREISLEQALELGFVFPLEFSIIRQWDVI